MGKQLDSLADAVTFGVAPGIIVFLLFSRICSLYEWPIWVGFFAFLLVIASIYRLAKFNIDKRQSDSFRGVANSFQCVVLDWHCVPLFHGEISRWN